MTQPADVSETMNVAEPVTLPYFNAPTGDIFASEAALKALGKTRPWALGCAIGMFVYALVGGVLGTMWLFVAIFKAPGVGLAQFIIMSTPNLIGAPLALVGGLLAIRYHRAVNRALARRNTEDLERALIVQLHIWRWAAVTVLGLFATPPIIVAVGFATGAWR
jgi:hypothetical protein